MRKNHVVIFCWRKLRKFLLDRKLTYWKKVLQQGKNYSKTFSKYSLHAFSINNKDFQEIINNSLYENLFQKNRLKVLGRNLYTKTNYKNLACDEMKLIKIKLKKQYNYLIDNFLLDSNYPSKIYFNEFYNFVHKQELLNKKITKNYIYEYFDLTNIYSGIDILIYKNKVLNIILKLPIIYKLVSIFYKFIATNRIYLNYFIRL